MKKGILSAMGAYVIWGLLPIYLKMMQDILPLEVLLNRMIWSLIFIFFVLVAKRHFSWIRGVIKNPKTLWSFVGSASMIGVNWFVFIWAITANRVVDVSLGYFILPLVNVTLGYFLLHERLRIGQWFAVAIAACGVVWLTIDVGQLPWIAVVLAITFSFYSLFRKTAALGALEGLAVETTLLAPVALVWMFYLAAHNQSSFVAGTDYQRFLLIISGPITAIPLLMFASGARIVPLYLLGFLQFIGPTLQLLLGIFLWHEVVSQNKIIGFIIVWSSLVVYSCEAFLFWHKKRRQKNDVKKEAEKEPI